MQTQKPTAFGELLRRYRAAAVLTQEELAARAGLSLRAVSDLERGVKSRPHPHTVRRLAEALGLHGAARAAFEAARGRGPSPAAPGRGPSGAGSARSGPHTPVVGRVRELALLEHHLTPGSLAGPVPPVLLLAGEPGIGKSHLLRAAAGRATGQGWQVLTGGCQRRNGHAPFAPLLEALEAYIAHRTPAALRGDLRGCAWLVRLLPELVGGPIEPLPVAALPPEQERRLMDRAVGRFLANVAGPAGTVLLLDDLQWAGADALTLLASLVRAAPESSLRVIAAYRDTEVAAHDPLADVLADLAHAGMARQHPLGPLPADDAHLLLSALLDGWPAVPAGLRERVVQRASGVPFFLVSYAQGLRGDGQATRAGEAVPWDVMQGVRQRLALLPLAAQELLGAAAVIGRVVPTALLTAVADVGEREVLAALAAASRARLLLEDEHSYQFAHDLIREVAEADIGAARRIVLHRRIAEALEAAPGERAVEMLAYHYGRAGVLQKAALYLEQAGDRAWAQHANAAAEGYYREAVARLDRLAQPLAAARVREKVGLVLHMAAQNEVTLAVLEQAAAAYQTVGDLESQARVAAQMGLVQINMGRHTAALARLQPLAERLQARGPSYGLVKLYAVLADLLIWFCGRHRDGLAMSARAVAFARLLGDTQLLAEALAAHGHAHVAVGHLADAQQALEEAIPLAEAAGDFVESLPKALWLLSIVHLRYGEIERSTAYCERELVVTERFGQAARTAAARVLRGLLAYVRGEWVQARHSADVVLAADPHMDRFWATPLALTVLGLVCYGEGRWDDASRYLEGSAASTREGSPAALHFAPGTLAELDLRDGHPERAHARLAPLCQPADSEERDMSLLLPPYAWAYLELGDGATARAITQQAAADARARNDRLSLVDALRVQALVALRQDDVTAAQQATEEGLAVAWSMPYPYAAGRLLHIYGLLQAQQGQPEKARQRLEAALAIFLRLGARKDIEQAEQLLATLG